MEIIKTNVRKLIRSFGYEIARRDAAPVGFHKFNDIHRLLSGESQPEIIDVGANMGQSIEDFKQLFPNARVHSFEPSPTTFKELERVAKAHRDVFPNNLAVGRVKEMKTFLENSSNSMSSFLETDKECWGEIVRETPVPVTTIDSYAEENGIKHIHLLKSDTQGYDLEVLGGAEKMLNAGAVQLILVEIIFGRLYYKGCASLDSVFKFLTDRDYLLVALYDMHYRSGVADWCDTLFVHKNYAPSA